MLALVLQLLERNEELDEEDRRKDIGKYGYFLCLAGADLDQCVADKREADAVSDGTGDGHCEQHYRNRCALRDIFEVYLLEVA